MQIATSDAKAQLPELMRRAEAGEDVVITRHGQPRIRLVPVEQDIDREAVRRRRLAGIDRAIAAAKLRGPDGGSSAARSQDYLYDEFGLPA